MNSVNHCNNLKNESMSFEKNVYQSRINKDVYVTTTSYHPDYTNNILEIGKTTYFRYINEDRFDYEFKDLYDYDERFDYYDLGACTKRSRENSIFEKEDYKKLLFESLFDREFNYEFANNLEESLLGKKHILLLEKCSSKNNKNNPRTIQLRAVTLRFNENRNTYSIKANDWLELKFSDKAVKDLLENNKEIIAPNNKTFYLYLNNEESLENINKEVVNSIGYTFV